MERLNVSDIASECPTSIIRDGSANYGKGPLRPFATSAARTRESAMGQMVFPRFGGHPLRGEFVHLADPGIVSLRGRRLAPHVEMSFDVRPGFDV